MLVADPSDSTVVIRHHNGSYENVALIEGTQAYIDLLKTTGPEREPKWPTNTWEKIEYERQLAQRRLNKLLGRPATPDIAILAEMVADLRDAAKESLGASSPLLTAAVISAPDHFRMSDEETSDILDYLKLNNLKPERWGSLGGAVATYAGYGQGLCTHYLDEYACEREQARLRTEVMLHVGLDDQSLTCATTTLSYVYWGGAQTASGDPGLGYHNAVRDPQYWSMVTEEIRRHALYARGEAGYARKISAVVLSGPRAGAELKQAVEEALRDQVDGREVRFVVPGDMGSRGEMSYERNGTTFNTFVTARGAAELAKRVQEGPYECAQTAECRRRRERVHEEAPESSMLQQPFFRYQRPLVA